LEGLSWLLSAVLEVLGVPRAFVRALEVSHKGLSQVRPIVDPIGREMLEPSTCRVGELEQEVLNDETIAFCTARVVGQTIVVEPQARVRFPGVLGDVRRQPVSQGYAW